MKTLLTSLILTIALLTPTTTIAVPSHFEPTIKSSLLCRDAIYIPFLTDYMSKWVGQYEKYEGEAMWWKMSDKLLGSNVKYIFVGRSFFGAVFTETPEELMANITKQEGTKFVQINEDTWSSMQNSIVIRYHDKVLRSKLVCL